MFSFASMIGNYDSRKVDRYDEDQLHVSTARVTDSEKPFETAVAHPDYREGDWIIVETYDTLEDAQEGHLKWVKTMTSDPLPETLVDRSGADITTFLDVLDETKSWRTFPRKP